MRNTEELTAEIYRRAAEIRRKQLHRRNRAICFSSAAVSLILIICTALAMPGTMDSMHLSGGSAGGLTASMFAGTGVFGYILVGVLAFVLGLAVAILCCRLSRREKEQSEKTEKTDD